MRSQGLWIGVTCGVALALGVVAAVDAGAQTTGATSVVVDSVAPRPARADHHMPSHPFTVSITQHVIDQRIASTGVRRSNRALKRRLWASLDSSGAILHQSGPKSGPNSFAGDHPSTGKYVVDFKRDVSACSWIATPFVVGNLANNPPPRTAVTARAHGQPTEEVTVYVFEASAVKNSNVDVQVLC